MHQMWFLIIEASSFSHQVCHFFFFFPSNEKLKDREEVLSWGRTKGRETKISQSYTIRFLQDSYTSRKTERRINAEVFKHKTAENCHLVSSVRSIMLFKSKLVSDYCKFIKATHKTINGLLPTKFYLNQNYRHDI